MTYRYRTRGTCSREIILTVENGVVQAVQFVGGCNGNTQGIAALAEGMPAEQVMELLCGIDCNRRGTSCPDQLARALKAYKEQNA